MNIAVEELAKWIQEDRMQMTDIKRDSLVRQLYRYKAAIPPGEIAEVEPMFFAKSIEKLKRGVNEIEELEKLYLFQLRRISMDGATEEKINKLFSGMNKEIQLAADLLNKLIEKKMELGILSGSRRSSVSPVVSARWTCRRTVNSTMTPEFVWGWSRVSW